MKQRQKNIMLVNFNKARRKTLTCEYNITLNESMDLYSLANDIYCTYPNKSGSEER